MGNYECRYCDGLFEESDIIPGETDAHGFHYCAQKREVSVIRDGEILEPSEDELLEFVDCLQAWLSSIREESARRPRVMSLSQLFR